MKKTDLLIIFFLFMTLVFGAHKSYSIINCYPEGSQVLMYFTKGVTLILSIVIIYFLYRLIFYLSFKIGTHFKQTISKNQLNELFAWTLGYLGISELIRYGVSLIYLNESLSGIVPDLTFLNQLELTAWYRYDHYTELAFLLILPLYLFYCLRYMNIKFKTGIYNTVVIISGFTLLYFL